MIDLLSARRRRDIIDYIYQQAERLVRRFGTRDPFEIARCLEIDVMFRDDFNQLKGMYAILKRQRFIFINANLPEQLCRLICAHELGHDQLHQDLAMNEALKEFTLMDMSSRPENEANTYAAHVLLDEGQILELAGFDYDIWQIAGELGEVVDILLVKMREMNKKGCNINIPYVPPSDFLRRK